MDKTISRIILSFYALLIVFAIISLFNPKWLQKVSEAGRTTEAMTYINDANRNMYQGNFGAAIQLYQQALSIDSTNRVIYGNLGIAHMKIGEFTKADYYLKKGHQLSVVKDSIAMFNYFESMGNLRKSQALANPKGEKADQYFEEALGFYENAIRVFPHSPNLMYRYADLLFTLGRDSLSIQAFNEGIAMEKSPETLYYAALFESYIPEVAKSEMDLAHQISEKMKAHDIDWDRFDTEILLQQHLKSNQLALAYYRLVELYLRNQQNERAEKAIAQCLAVNPGARADIEKLKAKY